MEAVRIYRTKTKRWAGTSYDELIKKARRFFRQIEGKTKRRPYVRSAYFDKSKIFFDYYLAASQPKTSTSEAKKTSLYRVRY